MVQPLEPSSGPGDRTEPGPVVWFGPFRFDRAELLLYRGTSEVALPPRALAVLDHLLSRPGRLVPKQLLLDAVWKDSSVTETSLIEAVSVVRQALGDDAQQPTYIQTVHRRGYRFVAVVSTTPPAVDEMTAAVGSLESGRSMVAAPSPTALTPARRLRLVAAGLGTLALFSTLVWKTTQVPFSPRPVTRAVIALNPSDIPAETGQPTMALSPDGVRLIYVAGAEGERRLYLRAMNELTATVIEGTEGAYGPVFSRDGEWIAFFADGALKKVSVRGRAPQVLAPAAHGYGASWGRDGSIVFSADAAGGLQRIPADGGPAVALTRIERGSGETGHRWPEVLPDGKTVIATRWRSTLADARIGAFAIESGESTGFDEEGSGVRYAPTGHLIFGRAGELLAVPFDPKRLEVSGLPAVIVRDAVTDRDTGASHFTFSETGALVYLSADGERATANLVIEWFAELTRLVPPSSLFRPVSSRAELKIRALPARPLP
jgi:DNA-binding winged helix-turn-helix (wHTH) protein